MYCNTAMVLTKNPRKGETPMIKLETEGNIVYMDIFEIGGDTEEVKQELHDLIDNLFEAACMIDWETEETENE